MKCHTYKPCFALVTLWSLSFSDISDFSERRLSVALTLGILGSVRQNSISSAKFFRLWGNFLDGNILCQKPKIFNS